MNRGIGSLPVITRAIELAGLGCWVLDLRDQRIWGSETAFQWLGYTEASAPSDLHEMIGLVHQDDQDKILRWFRAVIAGQSTDALDDYRLRTPTGGWRWLQTKAEMLPAEPPDKGPQLLIVGRDVTKNHLLQSALKESEARWTSLVDEAPVGISLLGPTGLVKFTNRREAQFHQESVIGRNIKDDLPMETHGAVESALGKALHDGVPTSVETYRRGPDGATLYFENHISPVRDPDAKTAMLISLDVTQQHLVRRRQRKESRRNEILLALHGATYQGRPQIFRLACLAAKELTDADEAFLFLGNPKTSLDLVAHSERAVTAETELLMRTLVSGVPWDDESGSGLKGEGWQLIVSTGGVLASEGGIAVVSNRHPFLPDDRRELQNLFSGLWQVILTKEQEARLEQLYRAVECTPVSISVVNPQGEVVFGNRRFCVDMGVPEGNLLAVNLWALHSELADEALLEDLQQNIRDYGTWHGELPLRKSDGVIITESVSVSPVSTGEEASRLFVVVKEDISERKAAQELVFQAQKMETLGQLAAGVAHDFNNLLTSMLAYNEMVQRRAEQPDSVRQLAGKIQLAGERASELVSGLLAAGRRQRLNPEVVDLGKFLAGEEGLLESLARDRFRLERGSKDLTIPVEIDTTQIGQVLANLVTNARDAILEKGSEMVLSYGESMSDGQQWAWFRLEDDGPGIPKEIQDRIFEPFFTTKTLGKGTGLGLAMVQGIIQQHRGKLLLDSEPGRGTRVTILLPTA